MTKKKSTGARGLQRDRTPFEWSILIAAALAIALVTGSLIVAGLRAHDGVRLAVVITGVESSATGDTVSLTVRNTGGHTATGVVVRVEAGDHSGEITIDRVAKRDTEDVEAIVPAGRGGAARATVIGYTT